MGELYPVLEESTQSPDGDWLHKCGTIVMGKTVLLSVRDGLFPLSGSGEVVSQVVPYCPSCETEPSTYGTIDEKDTPAAKEEAILRGMQQHGKDA